MKKTLLPLLVCSTSIVLIWCTSTPQETTIPQPTPQEIVYTSHVIPEKIDGLAHLASFYASLSCMVADKNFGTREWYTDPQSIYTTYWYQDRLLLTDSTKIYADQPEFSKTFFRYIKELCPWRISPSQQADIAEQLRRDAL